MKKAKGVLVLMAFLLIAAGCASTQGQNDSAKTATPQAKASEHADHASHVAAKPADAKPGPAGPDMSQMSDMNKQHEAMMAQMKNMHAQMEKIKATKSPVERRKLMREHMAAMGSGMKMMREMDDKMMMTMMQSGKCPMMEMMSSPQGQAGMQGMMGDMTMCHQMMRQKADMHHGMMEQFLESQEQLLELTK